VWGAAGPDAFDCSGLTMWAWAQAGVSISHYTGAQLAETTEVSEDEAQPGDLILFWSGGGDPGHVGMYIGSGMMVHAPHSGDVVKTQSVHYWSGARLSFRRVG
jgi:cell wall-associated NlpC family hydrolase